MIDRVYYDMEKTKIREECYCSEEFGDKIEIITSYYEDGNIEGKLHYVNDKAHKEDGPAFIHYYENGKVMSENYIIRGQFHKEDGPAVILYHEDGSLNEVEYWLNGIAYNEFQYMVITSCGC